MSFLVQPNYVSSEINKIFDALLTDPSFFKNSDTGYTTFNSYKQSTNETSHIIEVPLIGVEKKDLLVEVENNVLTISANPQEKSYFVKEFKKTWSVPQNCNVENMTAELKNGLLKVVIPKKKETNKKIINID